MATVIQWHRRLALRRYGSGGCLKPPPGHNDFVGRRQQLARSATDLKSIRQRRLGPGPQSSPADRALWLWSAAWFPRVGSARGTPWPRGIADWLGAPPAATSNRARGSLAHRSPTLFTRRPS